MAALILCGKDLYMAWCLKALLLVALCLPLPALAGNIVTAGGSASYLPAHGMWYGAEISLVCVPEKTEDHYFWGGYFDAQWGGNGDFKGSAGPEFMYPLFEKGKLSVVGGLDGGAAVVKDGGKWLFGGTVRTFFPVDFAIIPYARFSAFSGGVLMSEFGLLVKL